MVKRFVSMEHDLRDDDDDESPPEDDEEALRKQDILILRRVRARMQQTQRNIVKLHNNLRFLKRCAINCLDIVDNAVDVLEHEGQETRRAIQMVEQDEPSSHRGHRVNPMIAGFTLKRAKISLKRLTPMHQLQVQERRVSTSHLRSILQDIDVGDISENIENINTVANPGGLSSEEENPNMFPSS